MNDKDSKSLDIFGIKPYGDSIKIVAKGSVDGAAAFLGRICLPAAEEFGLLLKDKVHQWRSKNLVDILQKTEDILNANAELNESHAPPRLALSIIENGSMEEDPNIQDMWAGLLASSCTPDGKDDGNLIFINLLSQITSAQAVILNYACEKSEKITEEANLVFADSLEISLDELFRITEIDDINRLDRELDYLRGSGLLDAFSGIDKYDNSLVHITPADLALHMYVKCKGLKKTPLSYFKPSPKT